MSEQSDSGLIGTFGFQSGKIVKGKSLKNAPTYIAEEKVEEAKWVCSICGYVYDGETPIEEPADDFVCLLCKQPELKFVCDIL